MSTDHQRNPKVFISYSHDSRAQKERVLDLSNRLRQDGVDATIDEYEQFPEEGWPVWMERQIRESAYVLVVCTERYLRKTENRERSSGVAWESTLSLQEIYDAGRNRKFVPVVFEAGDEEYIPQPLKAYTRYCLDDEGGYETLYRQLTGQPYAPRPTLGEVRVMAARGEDEFEEGHDVTGSHPHGNETPGDRERTRRIMALFTDYAGSDPNATGPAHGLQCVTQNIEDGEVAGNPSFHIRLNENFIGAFTNGARFLIRFHDVLDGVRLGVRNRVVAEPEISPIGIFRVEGADENGAGGQTVTPDDSVWEVPIDGCSGYVVYEVVYASHRTLSRIDVPVIAGWHSDPGPSCGVIQADAVMCPISSERPTPEGAYPDWGASPDVVLSIVACTTSLLFPFVTTRNGLSTSVVISNTSEEWLGGTPRDGECEIHYHGSTSGGGPSPPTQTSCEIRAGHQLTFDLATGNPAQGIDPTPGFQGYIDVVCDFQPAHGMAFINDGLGGQPTQSYTYMAVERHLDD